MADLDKVISALDCLANGGGTYDCLKFPCPYGFYGYTDCRKWEIARDALDLLKEQEDLGTELTNAVELIHKKNERIEKLLKEQEKQKFFVDENGKITPLPVVVRCKDCKFGKIHGINVECIAHEEVGYDPEPWHPLDWFCADGERE